MTPDPFDAFATPAGGGLRPITKLVWLYLFTRADGIEAISETSAEIARRVGVTKSTVEGAMQDLEGRGLLEVVDRGGPRRPRRVRAVLPAA